MQTSLAGLKEGGFSGDIALDQETRMAHATDTSLFSVLPAVVAYPKNVADVEKLVSYASSHDGVTLTGRCAGTGMDGGSLTEGVAVDFSKYFTHMSAVESAADGASGSVSAQPGVFYRDFEKATRAKNLLMPSYPASRELCQVGGMTMNNAGGELTLRYGKTQTYVRAVRAVLADGQEHVLSKLSFAELKEKMAREDFEGNLHRRMYQLIDAHYDAIARARPKVSKNSAGYYLWDVYNKEAGTFDLSKLFVGSQGTLGLLTETTFDLIRPPGHSQMVVFFLDSFDHIGEIVRTVLSHRPTTFESYDDKTLRLALRFFWEFVKRLGVGNIFTLIKNSIPEGLSILRHGLPKLILQVTFDGDDMHALRAQAETMAQDIAQFHPRYAEVIRSGTEMDEYWLIRRESFNLLRHKVKGMKTAPFIDDIVVPTEVLPEFFPKLYAILADYEMYMIHNIAGHIGNGNFHIIPLMDLTKEKNRAVIPEIAQRVYDLVLSYGGSITGEHNDGLIRTPFLRQQYGDEMCALFAETKKIFDPKGIFNPGKKVPSTRSARSGQVPSSQPHEPDGTLAYAMAHIKTTM